MDFAGLCGTSVCEYATTNGGCDRRKHGSSSPSTLMFICVSRRVNLNVWFRREFAISDFASEKSLNTTGGKSCKARRLRCEMTDTVIYVRAIEPACSRIVYPAIACHVGASFPLRVRHTRPFHNREARGVLCRRAPRSGSCAGMIGAVQSISHDEYAGMGINRGNQ